MFVKWTPRPPAVDLHFEHQTTNLGVRSSNFFGRASFLHSPCDSHGIHTARKSLFCRNPYVSVFVIDPPIGPDPRGMGEPPQHVFRLGHSATFPRLCIHDPIEDEWWPDEYIVDRIIPWTIKWLFFHEEWVATGEWKGGGRHPEAPEPCLKDEDLDPESRARRERFRNAREGAAGTREVPLHDEMVFFWTNRKSRNHHLRPRDQADLA